MIDEDDFWSNWWNEDWQGKPKYMLQPVKKHNNKWTNEHYA
jgi:hypothetical protein